MGKRRVVTSIGIGILFAVNVAVLFVLGWFSSPGERAYTFDDNEQYERIEHIRRLTVVCDVDTCISRSDTATAEELWRAYDLWNEYQATRDTKLKTSRGNQPQESGDRSTDWSGMKTETF